MNFRTASGRFQVDSWHAQSDVPAAMKAWCQQAVARAATEVLGEDFLLASTFPSMLLSCATRQLDPALFHVKPRQSKDVFHVKRAGRAVAPEPGEPKRLAPPATHCRSYQLLLTARSEEGLDAFEAGPRHEILHEHNPRPCNDEGAAFSATRIRVRSKARGLGLNRKLAGPRGLS